ncbi:MAG TPA: group III truncated hemoglobin [Methylocystis sp.]|nr:group III truncated hemoglobin [Methylocystis sp.]
MTFDFPLVEDAAERARVEAAIEACVRSFYAKGAADPLLGPVFDKIPELEKHLGVVVNFWSKSLLHTERYDGHPFSAHINLPIEPEHFARWLQLFSETAKETLPETQAAQAIAKASHMTQCFQAGLFPFTDAAGRPSRLPAQEAPREAVGAH